VKTLALYSIKGGVGKTAAAVNLAHAAARSHGPVLLVDLDPQGAASFYFRVRARRKFTGRRLLRGGKQVDRNIRGTDFPGLDILPASFSFRKLERRLAGLKRPRRRLRNLLARLRDEYPLVVVDSPPGINLLAENVLQAADLILVPVVPTTLSERTLEQLAGFCARKGLGADRLAGFFSLVEARKKLHRETMERLRDGEVPFLSGTVPYSAEVERMGLHRQPVACYRPNATAAAAYAALWEQARRLLEG
jgi:cellulose biosynthesis protein BcsQ